MASQFEVKVNVRINPQGVPGQVQAAIGSGRYEVRIDRIDATAAISRFQQQLQNAVNNAMSGGGGGGGRRRRRNMLSDELLSQQQIASRILQKMQSEAQGLMNYFNQSTINGRSALSSPFVEGVRDSFEGLRQQMADVRAGNEDVIRSIVDGSHTETQAMTDTIHRATELRKAMTQVSGLRSERDRLSALGASAQQLAPLDNSIDAIQRFISSAANGDVAASIRQSFEAASKQASGMVSSISSSLKVQIPSLPQATKQIDALGASAQKVFSTIGDISLGGNLAKDTRVVQELRDAYTGLQQVAGRIASGDRQTAQSVLSGTNAEVQRFEQALSAAQTFASHLGTFDTLRKDAALFSGLDVDQQRLTGFNNQLGVLEQSLIRVGDGEPFAQMAQNIVGAEENAKALGSTLQQSMKRVVSDQQHFQDVVGQINSTLKGDLSPQQRDELVAIRDNFQRFASSTLVNPDEVKRSEAALADFNRRLKESKDGAGKAKESLSGMFKTALKQRLIGQVFALASKAVREMIQAVRDVNDSLTQLKIVTAANDRELSNFLDSATEKAKELGANIQSVLDSIEVFSRLGYGLTDALDLANAATLMSNVGATTVDEATTGITSIIKGFGLEASEAEFVADKLVEVGHKYAISAAELMTAMQNGGAAMSAANNDLDETIAIFAAGNAAVQDASKVGTAMKTVQARIRGATAELDEMGEEYDDLVGQTAKYREEILALSGVDIMLDGSTFKSTYQILLEIAEAWDGIEDVQQAALLERLAGKRNTSVLMSILSNIDDLTGAYAASADAAGTASEANDIYMDNIAGRIGELKATAEDLSTTLLDDDVIKGAVTSAKVLLETLNSIFKVVGGTGPLLVGIASGALVAIIAKLKTIKAESIQIKALWSGKGAVGKGALVGLGVTAALSVIQTIYTLAKEAKDKCLELADEAYQAFNNAKDTAAEYADEIQDLYGVLNQAATTDVEAYEAKQRLYEIQSELNELYGDAAPIVTQYKQSIDNLAAQLRGLADLEAYEILSGGGSALRNEASKVASARASISALTGHIVGHADVKKVVEDFYDNHGDMVSQVSDWDQLGSGETGVINLSGNAYEIKQALLDLYSELSSVGGVAAQSVMESVSAALKDVNQIIEDSGDSYEQYVTAKVRTDPALRSLFDTADQAKTEFQEAIVSGEYQTAKNALGEWQQAKNDILARADAPNTDVSVAQYLKQFSRDVDDAFAQYTPELNVGLVFGADSESSQTAEDILDSIAVWEDEHAEIDIYKILNYEKGQSATQDAAYDAISAAAEEFGYVLEDSRVDIEGFLHQLISMGVVTSSVAMNIDDLRDIVDQFAGDATVVSDALEEVSTAGGLTSDTIKALVSRYRSLDDFSEDDLFEYTANGVALNTEALKKYESALRTKSLDELKQNLRRLRAEFEDAAKELDGSRMSVEEYKEALDNLDDIADEAEAVERLIAQYEGLTSAYTEWQRAKETANPGDIYEQAVEDRELLAELYKQGNIGRDDFTEGVKFFFGGSTADMNAYELQKVYEDNIEKAHKLFDDDQVDGLNYFITAMHDLEFVSKDASTGMWKISGSVEEMSEKLASYIGLTEGVTVSTSAMYALLGQLQDKGWKIDIDTDSVSDELHAVVEKARMEIGGMHNDALVTIGDTANAAIDSSPSSVSFSAQINNADELAADIAAICGPHKIMFTAGWQLGQGGSQSRAGAQNQLGAAASVGAATGKATKRAFADGSRGRQLGSSGTALGGELGPELIVRDGRFFTVGNNGAEMFAYKKGDIIFNADQTRELLDHGSVGYAFAGGSASGEVDWREINKLLSAPQTSAVEQSLSALNRTEVAGTGQSIDINEAFIQKLLAALGSGSGSKFDPKDFDWVEVLLQRIQRTISNLETIAGNTYKTYSERSGALQDTMAAVTEEIGYQKSAYDVYMAQANSVGLSESWAVKVRNGELDIDTISDESLHDKITEYQDWYEKALDCEDALIELSETLSSLYEEKFAQIESEFDGVLSRVEHASTLIDNYITKAETAGYLVSARYYEELIKVEQENAAILKDEQSALVASLNSAVNSGAIAVYSEAWYDLQQSIDEVTAALVESQTAVIEYENAIRQLSWDSFDRIAERISDITNEADWLIGLLEGSKLFDDKGVITDEGLATMGLHVQNYSTYIQQMKEYADELVEVNAAIAEDPADTALAERKQELVEAYRDVITAAEDERQALKDLVADGIDLQLEAVQELIDAYNDSLDSAKDLYDYQKSVEEHGKTISSLEKQLMAYDGDDTEETKAKVQQIKVDLESARDELEAEQYDKYISDTKSLLDNLYTEYETVLNKRLDNIDALVEGCTLAVENGAGDIVTTIKNAIGGTGYTLQDAMQTIWTGSAGMTVASGVTEALADIKASLDRIYSAAFGSASDDIESAKDSPVAMGTPGAADSQEAPMDEVQAESPSATKDFFISKKSGANKKSLSVNTSLVDRLKYNDFDSSFSARSSYYSAMGFSGKYTGSAAQNTQMLAWLKSNGYRRGVRQLASDELAWTQERGAETILRPSDGAILTTLKRRDSVLNNAATDNLWSFANEPQEFIARHTKDVPMCGVAGGDTIQNSIELSITLPNVKNYDDFMNAAKSDPKFERLVQAMTTERIAGRSAMAKNSLNW